MSDNKVKIPRTRTSKKSTVDNQITDAVTSESPGDAVKRVFQSKTIWVNVLALIALFVQEKYGFVVSEELQMQLLTLINIALRFVTHEKIAWK